MMTMDRNDLDMMEYACGRIHTAFHALMDAQRRVGCIGYYSLAMRLDHVAHSTAKLLGEASDVAEHPDGIVHEPDYAKVGLFCLNESFRMLEDARYFLRKDGDIELSDRLDKLVWEVLDIHRELEKRKNEKEEEE